MDSFQQNLVGSLEKSWARRDEETHGQAPLHTLSDDYDAHP